jgi:hypothetical protein
MRYYVHGKLSIYVNKNTMMEIFILYEGPSLLSHPIWKICYKKINI